ncbi:outer membrane protein assembly factor BamD [Aestuariispira insulae]|uniref:Outer membrane protein assembly factor BamD n=1 Tax=Aestuariispira insulae TaxID=1461337 RepID=A0A3D9HX94_9PROT|nr:outer membrane protein assembly factor BamD [Aestuariispira insulae]RED54122.1 Beta-barrel assembly machine subunit BamD [Aestuariispira insulae]
MSVSTDALRRSFRGIILAAAAMTLLAACSSNDEPAPYVERPVEELYNEAMDLFEQKEYSEAATAFDEVDRQHPYSIWATKAQLMTAYVHYLSDKYDEAIIALDRFIELHPGNPDTPYAYYLRAIAYYEQITDVQRDQKITRLALNALQDVAQRYPDTTYARDALLKIDLARDHLAGKEMAIGRFYLKRGEHLAAINRFRTVIQNYQTTTHVPEALHRLVESYLSLGISDEAQMAAAVLGHNFPASQWYADSYQLLEGKDLAPEENQGWLSQMWDWVF